MNSNTCLLLCHCGLNRAHSLGTHWWQQLLWHCWWYKSTHHHQLFLFYQGVILTPWFYHPDWVSFSVWVSFTFQYLWNSNERTRQYVRHCYCWIESWINIKQWNKNLKHQQNHYPCTSGVLHLVSVMQNEITPLKSLMPHGFGMITFWNTMRFG